MKPINLITLLLVIVGGVNWGLIGLFQFDLVAALFGGQQAVVSRIVYVLVGLSALWQLVPFGQAINAGEVSAERGYLGNRPSV